MSSVGAVSLLQHGVFHVSKTWKTPAFRAAAVLWKVKEKRVHKANERNRSINDLIRKHTQLTAEALSQEYFLRKEKILDKTKLTTIKMNATKPGYLQALPK